MTAVRCPHCSADVEVNGPGEFVCYQCDQPFNVAPHQAPPVLPQQKRATRQTKSKGTGWWSILIVLGWLIMLPCLLMFLSAIFGGSDGNEAGTVGALVIVCIPLFIGAFIAQIGNAHSKETICSNCGESVGNHAKLCKTCGCSLRLP